MSLDVSMLTAEMRCLTVFTNALLIILDVAIESNLCECLPSKPSYSGYYLAFCYDSGLMYRAPRLCGDRLRYTK
jgi:hypothetical protein